MKTGCAIVMDVKTSSILACVIKPDSTYVNKAVQQYALGSVFKLVVSACAIENNVDISYNCFGKITVGDTIFSCSHNYVHGYQNLKTALANSCNCYFVNLALTLGAEKLLATAKSFGFDLTTNLYSSWNFENASLPTLSDLSSKGQLSLFGFGQGLLLSTPLQVGNMLCTIGNNGKFNQTKLVSSTVDKNGSQSKIKQTNEKQAISSNTAKTLLSYMRYVVSNGTGKNANTFDNKSAGKTGTAQSGQYLYGKEQLNTWFAGIYPYDNPKYAIVVMCENGTSGSADCCPIFRTIVENIN
jgi:cell division protein FtsI/penicillin-binding protein 2